MSETVIKQGKFINVIHSKARIALMRELLTHHKELVARLPAHELPYDELLAAIATEVGILVDEWMTPPELDILAEALTQELYKKRSIIII